MLSDASPRARTAHSARRRAPRPGANGARKRAISLVARPEARKLSGAEDADHRSAARVEVAQVDHHAPAARVTRCGMRPQAAGIAPCMSPARHDLSIRADANATRAMRGEETYGHVHCVLLQAPGTPSVGGMDSTDRPHAAPPHTHNVDTDLVLR